MNDVSKGMAIEDPLACLARADLALEKGDPGRARWWRGLAEALRASPSVQRAFAQCRTLGQLGDQLRRGRSDAWFSKARATLEKHGWLTDGAVLLRPTEAERNRLLRGAAFRVASGTPFDVPGLIASMKAGPRVFPAGAAADFPDPVPGWDEPPVRWKGLIRLSAGPRRSWAVAACYVGAIVRRHPEANWYAPTGSTGALLVKEGRRTVALVMPCT
jgi:hypothetical protein